MDWMQDGYTPSNQPNNQGGQNSQGGGNNYQRGGYNGGGNNGGYQRNNGGGGFQRGGGGGFQQPKPPVENPEVYLPYAVTSNKDVPQDINEKFDRVARRLNELGLTARTGLMDGLEAYTDGLNVRKELVIPWKGFAGKESPQSFNNPLVNGIAKHYMTGGNWDGLKPPARAFLAKNAKLVTGFTGTSRAMFVVCWSTDGCESTATKTFNTGNIGHVIVIANAYQVPVFNLQNHDAEERIFNYLAKIKNG